jgi:hypothetical protein
MNPKSKKNMKLTKSTFFLLSLVFLLAAGCGKKADGPSPELPPEGSFIMDFEDFDDGKMSSSRVVGADSTYSNFGYAGLNVLVWNVVITVNAAVPVKAFRESFNHEPDWDRRLQRYVWEYNLDVLGRRYTAQLQGWIEGSDTRWEMFLSQDNGFQNFLWYSGRSAIARNNANWTLNKDPQAPTPYIGIEYTANSVVDAQIRYTNIIGGHEENGGYIEFKVVDSPEFDRAYSIYSAKNDNLIEIEWSHLGLDGRVKDEIHFTDAAWHCWDAAYLDATCP